MTENISILYDSNVTETSTSALFTMQMTVNLTSNFSTQSGLDGAALMVEDTFLGITSAPDMAVRYGLNTEGKNECGHWREAQHVLFQLANMCFAIAFIIPASFQYHAVCMRGALCLASLLVVIWSGSITCHPDALTWYLLFFVLNIVYFLYSAYRSYPASFSPELEELFANVFRPLKVTRHQFRELTFHAQIKDLPNGATYALEGATHIGEKMSILLTGRLKVTCDSLLLHTVEPNQFVDSPEYEVIPNALPDGQEETFQVTITGLENSRLATWPASELTSYLQSHPFMHATFNQLLGRDITHKLYQVQELLLHNPHYVRLLSARGSLVHLRHKLCNGNSPRAANGNLYPQQQLQQHPANLPQAISPDSSSSLASRGSSHQVSSPTGPCSPSQISWETCV